MSEWGQGYVTDVGYTQTHFRELTPRYLALVALLQGYRPPDPDAPFRYLELGCGRALSLLASSIAHPESTFVGVDFNPEHVSSARTLAREAGIGNLQILERDFESFAREADRDEKFDFVALHGVYSWISDANREHVLSILSKCVAPGGIVFMSFNAMPGWAPVAPLQTLLRAQAGAGPNRSDKRIAGGLEFARKLADIGAGYFAANPSLAQHLERIGQQDARYLAHEYLNATWKPLPFTDVAASMARVKLGYLGSTSVPRNTDRFIMSAEAQHVVNSISDPALAEYVRDLIGNTVFRRDVWARGAEPLTMAERLRLLGRSFFVAATEDAEAPTSFEIPVGEIRYPEDLARAMWSALRAGPVPFDRLGAESAYDLSDRTHYLSFLLSDGRAHPSWNPERRNERALAAAGRINRIFATRAADAAEPHFLAAPAIGGALQADAVDRLIFGLMADGTHLEPDDVLARVVDTLRKSGSSVSDASGKTIEDPQAIMDALRPRMTRQALERRAAVWRRTGLL